MSTPSWPGCAPFHRWNRPVGSADHLHLGAQPAYYSRPLPDCSQESLHEVRSRLSRCLACCLGCSFGRYRRQRACGWARGPGPPPRRTAGCRPRPPSLRLSYARWSSGSRRRWSTSTPRAWSRTAIRCSTIRSSAASSAAGRAAARAGAALARLRRASSMPSGLVVTNNHVIEGATEVKVALADKREFEAEIVLKDARTDLAVLRIKDRERAIRRRSISANSDELQVGDLVLAIGNPFGVGQTVTHGIVSALARTQVGITDYQFFIQTDAAINPGNSGGALVDIDGRLVGINTAIFSRSGGSLGIGFAIPANMVQVVVASAQGRRQRGQAALARRQAAGGDAGDRRERSGSKRPAGALVASVIAGEPGGARRPQDRRSDRRDRRPGGRRSRTPSTTASPPSRSAAPRKLGVVQRGGKDAIATVALADRAGNAARRDRHPGALAVSGREGRQPLAGARRGTAARRRRRRRGDPRRRQRLAGAARRLPARRHHRLGQRRARSTRRAISNAPRSKASRALARHHRARRPADLRRCSADEHAAEARGPNLFAAAGLDQDAPRPLADRLRPQRLAEVVGQDHLLGPDGALTRMLGDALARLDDLLGPARHRQDHGRAAAGATRPTLHFEQISAIFSGVADLKKVFEAARAPARDRAGHAAVRRRDPSLQPRPAGQLPAGDGGRHGHAGRRHHREPVLRAQRGAAVARARAGVPVARRGGDREAAGARRGDRRQGAAARRRGARRADPHGRRRRPRVADARRGSLARRARRARSSTPQRCRRSCSAARRSTTRRRTATTI